MEEIIKLIDAYWRFDKYQMPMSSWHDKQDLIEAIRKAGKNFVQPDVIKSVCDCDKLPKGEIAISSKALTHPYKDE